MKLHESANAAQAHRVHGDLKIPIGNSEQLEQIFIKIGLFDSEFLETLRKLKISTFCSNLGMI